MNMVLKEYNIIHLPEVTSTNAYARELLRKGKPPEGTVVAADFQTAGRGQDTNTWESEAGKNILMSIILYPRFLPAEDQFSISMAISLGMADLLQVLLPGTEVRIKWPNDLYAGNRKIGGILINNEIMGQTIEHVIAGIGLNVNQLAFSSGLPNPVSIAMISGRDHDLPELTEQLWAHVMRRYGLLVQGHSGSIRSDYLDRLLGLGEWREYFYRGKKLSARIRGVDQFGRLQIETENGAMSCDLKEIGYVL